MFDILSCVPGFNTFSNMFKNQKNDELLFDVRAREYGLSFLEKISNLYSIVCKEIETKDYRILQYAYLNGHCGLAKFDEDNKYHVGIGTFVGQLTPDGYMDEYTITLPNGWQKTGKIGKDIVVLLYNNISHSQSLYMGWLSYMLADTDVSMLCTSKYSRLLPIPVVENDIEKKSMEEVLNNLFNGVCRVFKRQNTKGLLTNGATSESNILNITNPQATTYMQNLSRYHDELIIRASLEWGVYVSARDKGAQLNDKELQAFADYCAISADDVYNRLLDFAKDCKNVFGLEVTVTPKKFVYTEKDVEKDEDIEKKEGAEHENESNNN